MTIEEPNNVVAEALDTELTSANPSSFLETGIIDSPDDIDFLSFQLNEGDRAIVGIDTEIDDSELDSFLRLFDSAGNQVAFNDDDEFDFLDSFLEFIAPVTDTYFIGVSSHGNNFYNPETGVGEAGKSTGEYTIEVILSNNNGGNFPEANSDFEITGVNTPVTIDVLSNDFDPDGESLIIDRFDETSAAGGSISQEDNTDDALVYTPPTDLRGRDFFEYTITDELGNSSIAFVGILVGVTDRDDFADTEINTPVTVDILANDFEFNGLENFDETSTEGGTVTLDDNGTPENNTDDVLVYTPPENFRGVDDFQYTIADEFGNTDSTFVEVEVGTFSDRDDFTFTELNTSVTIDVLANDFDFDAIEIFDETSVKGGTVTLDDNGTPENNTDDVLIYSPPENFRGIDLFSYTAIDEEGNTADAFVEIEVEPIFPEHDFTQTELNSDVTIDVLANDFDDFVVGLDSFEETSLEGGTITLDDQGTPEDNTDDALVYTPPTDFVGLDDFQYTITDEFGNTASTFVEIQVGIIAFEDFVQTAVNNELILDVLANDSSFDAIESFEETSTEGGTVTLDDNGTPEDNTDDALVYTPPTDFVGLDFFEYTIADEFGNTAEAFVQVGVGLFAQFDLAKTNVNTEVTIDVLANDFNFSQLESFDETSTEGGTVTLDDNGTPEDNTDDALVYTPLENFRGFDDFQYKITDELGNRSIAFVDILVGVTDRDDFADTEINTPVTIDVLANDLEFNGLDNFDETSTEGGTVTLDDNGTPENNTDDVLVYTPPENFRGVDLFSYTAIDEEGNTADAFVEVEVGEPIFTEPDFTQTDINTPITIDVLANDINDFVVGLNSFEETSDEGGTVTLDDNGTSEDNTDDILVYTPPENFRGVDEFEYTIADEFGNTDFAFVEVEVGEAIIAEFDFAETEINTDVTIDVLANDINDFVVGLDSFDETSAEGGTITLDENGTPEDNTDDGLVYIPPTDFEGFDDFQYTIADEFGNTASTFVDVEVGLGTPEDDFAEDDFANTEVNTEVTIDVLENDLGFGFLFLDSFEETSAEGGTITRDNNGTPEDNTDDALVYTPPTDFEGVDFFEYTVIDEFGDIGFGLVEVEVGDSTPPPLSQVDDLIFGSFENDVLNAVDGNNPYSGDNQIAFLGEGDDTVDGTDAVGNNRLYTSLGDDSIIAAVGDRIFSKEGNDEILIQGDNYAFAGDGDDTIDARLSLEGSNRLYGQAGNDDLFASVNDVLFAGEGNDRLFVGTESDNLLTGNAGEDQFWVATGEVPNGINSITDFSLGEDTIGINLSEEVSFDDLVILSDGNNTLIGFDAENPFVSLQGIDSTELSESDFTFAETTI